MKRRRRALAVVGVALAAVVLAIAGVEIGTARADRARAASAAPAGAADEQSVPILVLDSRRITEIRLSSGAGALTLRLAKGAWKLAAPVSADVKTEALQGLMETFTALYSERVVAERPADLAPYGLDRPSAVGRATLADGTTRELRLGDRTPAGTTYYLMADDDPRVFAVWMSHGQRLGAGVNDLLEPRKLLTIDRKYLTYLRLSRAGADTIEVARTPGLVQSDVELRASYLSIVKPYARPLPLDSFLVTDAFLAPLGEVSLTALLDPDPADPARWGLAPAAAEVEVRDDATGNRFQVGKTADGLVAVRMQGEKTVWGASSSLADLLARQEPFDWASRFAAIVPMKAVDRVTIASTRGTRTLGITRVGTGDEVSELYRIDGVEAGAQPFRSFYQQLVSLEADAIANDPAAAGTADVTVAWRLLAGGEYRVTYVPRGSDFYAVVKNGVATGLLVNRTQVKAMLDALDALAANPSPATP